PRHYTIPCEKKVIATVPSRGLIDFDVGVVGRGSLATVTYLCGRRATSSRASTAAGFLPNDTDKDNARGTVAHLAQLEGCHWLDMQHALCVRQQSESFRSG
ncbi:MAG: hypothetical protein ACKPKO_54225, partial [Candidatus Fonsibacter sp.]